MLVSLHWHCNYWHGRLYDQLHRSDYHHDFDVDNGADDDQYNGTDRHDRSVWIR